MASGLSRMRAQREEHDREFARNRTQWVRELKLTSGESRKFWFFGSGDEPFLFGAHTVALGGKSFRRKTCAQSQVSGEPVYKDQPECVYCIANANQDPRVKRASDRAAFNVADCTAVHMVPGKRRDGKPWLRKDGKTPVLVEERCKGKSCALCAKKVERNPAGAKVLDMSTMYGESLATEEDKIRVRCAACWTGNGDEDSGTGEIEATGYECPECSATIPLRAFDPTTATTMGCPKCKKTIEPTELVTCSNGCENARRVTLWSGPWTMTRAGADKSTTYSFAFLGVQDRPEWVDALEPMDLHAAFWPDTPRKAAETLGIKTPPTGARVGNESPQAESYDEPPAAEDNPFADEDSPF